MRMKQFRIQNYKKIEDTGWINCDQITTFVGINEAGKSAIFRGLSKFNPSDKQEYNGIREFPRRRYSDEYADNTPVSSIKFELETHEQEELAEICSALQDVKSVEGVRYYSNDHVIKFLPELNIRINQVKEYLQLLQSWKEKIEKAIAPNGKGEQLTPIKESLSEVFSGLMGQLNSESPSSQVSGDVVNSTHTHIMSQMNEGWQQELFKKLIEESENCVERVKIHDELEKAKNWFLNKMPRFIYFDRYDVIQSAINIGEFITKLGKNSNRPELRVTKCLFEHVGLDLEKIRDLDPNDENVTTDKLRRLAADERGIRLSSASDTMTNKFKDWFENRKYKFRYDIDGQMFRVWISDNLNESDIELEQRSAGMQYFFSFYLVFLVEAADAHANTILLLDEPGLHYHGTAQKKAVELLQKISNENQVLYTTHSPFMIDGDKLKDVRIVYEDKITGNTLVSSDVWPTDKDSLFPLQAGLGYSIAQTLYYSEYQLVVEGLTDYSIFKAMNELLSRKDMKTLKTNLIITPAGGTRNILPLTSMLIGNKIKMVVFLDGDQPGLEKQKKLKEQLLVNCILATNYSDKSNAELEDLFPDELYVAAVKKSYPNKELDFNEDEKKIQNITKRVEVLFIRKEYGEFKKWKPVNVLIDWIQKDSSPNKIPDTTCKKFELIFVDVNKSFN